MTDPRYRTWSGTERRTVKRPFCDRCFDGHHDAYTHGEVGCRRVLASDYVCGCEYGATIDVCAPIPPDSGQTIGAMVLERASRLRGGKRTGEIKKAEAAMRRSA